MKTRSAASTAEGILEELAEHSNVGLVLMGWPGPLGPEQMADNPVKQILQKAHADVAVLLNRGLLLQPLRRLLVPVGGGPHSRLAVRLACGLAGSENAQVTVLRIVEGESRDQAEELEDQTSWLSEAIEDVLGEVPSNFALRTVTAGSVEAGVLLEAGRQAYNLIVIGASEEWTLQTKLFGAVDDWVADRAPCSVLLCRRWEPAAMSWLRRELKGFEQEHEHAVAGTPDARHA
jgi:nucleotide-binding universal stress UspA family protein